MARLGSPEPGVRRIAVHDLIALGGSEGVLADHLYVERDEKAVLLIIRHLARSGVREAGPVLLRLYECRATPARIAHAAIVAHDALIASGP